MDATERTRKEMTEATWEEGWVELSEEGEVQAEEGTAQEFRAATPEEGWVELE